MRKTIYRLKKFRLTEVSLVDRPACDAARVERVELAKRAPAAAVDTGLEQAKAEEKELMKSIESGQASTSKTGRALTRSCGATTPMSRATAARPTSTLQFRHICIQSTIALSAEGGDEMGASCMGAEGAGALTATERLSGGVCSCAALSGA